MRQNACSTLVQWTISSTNVALVMEKFRKDACNVNKCFVSSYVSTSFIIELLRLSETEIRILRHSRYDENGFSRFSRKRKVVKLKVVIGANI